MRSGRAIKPRTEGPDTQSLPKGWCLTTIGDTGEYINGFAFKPGHRETNGRPIIRIQNLTNPEKPLNRTTLSVPTSYQVATGEMLVSWSATVDVFIWNREPALVNQHIFRVAPDEDLVDQTFLFYWLKVSIDQLLESEHLHGSTMKHINRGPFMAHKIPLPPRAEQVRVAQKLDELLSDLDAGVAELKAAQRKLAQYRQSLLKAAVEGTLTADWRKARAQSGEPQEAGADLLQRILTERRNRWETKQLAKFAETRKTPPKDWEAKYPDPVEPDTGDLAPLPIGWAWASAEQVCEFITKGTTPPKNVHDRQDKTIPFLRVTNLADDGSLNLADRVFVSVETHRGFLARSAVYPGDVLMNIVGPPLGQVSVVPNDFDEWNINQAIAIFRPIAGMSAPFLCAVLLSNPVQTWLKKRAKTTAGQTNLTLEVCRALPLPLPSVSEQEFLLETLGTQIEEQSRQKKIIDRALKQCAAQRKNILKAAFAGQLVAQDPTDEPASALLERIRAQRVSGSAKRPVKNGRKPKEKA